MSSTGGLGRREEGGKVGTGASFFGTGAGAEGLRNDVRLLLASSGSYVGVVERCERVDMLVARDGSRYRDGTSGGGGEGEGVVVRLFRIDEPGISWLEAGDLGCESTSGRGRVSGGRASAIEAVKRREERAAVGGRGTPTGKDASDRFERFAGGSGSLGWGKKPSPPR